MEIEQTHDNTQSGLHKCAAHNCPLPGTSSGAVGGTPSHWTCSLHATCPPGKWPMLTQKINENLNIFKGYSRLVKLSILDWDDERKVYERSSYPPEEGEDLYTYRRRVLQYFYSRVSL